MRRTPVKERPDVWLIQETHVGTQEEAHSLEKDWRRLWGKQHTTRCPALSYWSVDATKTGGVAILLNPNVAEQVKPWMSERWNKRTLAVKWRGVQLVNIYAPNDHSERENFYDSLKTWPWQDRETVLAGDFNCVQCPALDRFQSHKSGRPESVKLQELQRQLSLEDAWTLMGLAEEDEERVEPTEFYTYWGPEAASRLDRFLVPLTWTAQVQWIMVAEPRIPSDHQRVRLHLRKEEKPKDKQRRRRGVVYPIQSSRPEKVRDELIQDLMDVGIGQAETTRSWDLTTRLCADSIRRIRQRETKRRREYRHKANRQRRAHLLTRNDLFRVTEEEARQEYLIRMGQRLERTTDQLRWQFKDAMA
ncbi:hypothetical protein PR001_g20671 [Phytophthora rubi]|uniref:Endonuclease/exonuclease/phosphatase domain-containing protein n=1 Tax=Phytophthora rubi TaxID=129364 RepID=A0A6A3JIB4_9STRA|nr:hypothetical protein PR001_g20671 [Phytophthora rubi]